jgi:cation transport ATPase
MKNIKQNLFFCIYNAPELIAAEFCIRFSNFAFPMIAALAMSFSLGFCYCKCIERIKL